MVLHSQLAKRSQGSGFRSQRRRKAVVDQAQLVVPALQIQFMYPFISFSSFCSSFKSRKPARDSTLSFSFANSLGGRPLFVHQNIGTQRILGTENSRHTENSWHREFSAQRILGTKNSRHREFSAHRDWGKHEENLSALVKSLLLLQAHMLVVVV